MILAVTRDPFDVLRERVWIARSCARIGRLGEVAVLNGMVAMLAELGVVDRAREARLTVLLGDLLRME